MPRPNPNTHISIMESRMSAVESIMANLSSLLAKAVNHACETRLPAYLEQFHRKQNV